MKSVSRGQSLELSSRFATQVKWGEIDGTKLQDEVIAMTPEEFGRRLTAFLNNGCRFIAGDLKVATRPFNPEKVFGAGYSIWRGPANGDGLKGVEDRDSAAAAVTEVDFADVDFVSVHEQDEVSVKCEEILTRTMKLGRIRHGGGVFMGLKEDYYLHGEGSVLERLYQEKGITALFLLGDILRNPNGQRCVLYFERDKDGKWWWHGLWTGIDLHECLAAVQG